MKKNKRKTGLVTGVVVITIGAALFLAGCGSSGTKENKPQKTEQSGMQKSDSIYYTCEMHPEVRSDKPGECPKCGMKLIRSDEIRK